MDCLMDALAMYASENLIPRFRRENAKTQGAWRKAEQLAGQLKALSPEAEKWMEVFEGEMLKIDVEQERAVLLGGISIGLELGQLYHRMI